MESWQENSVYILKKLEEFEKEHEVHNGKLDLILVEVTTLKTRSKTMGGVWGFLAGIASYFIIHLIKGVI